jgi:hypothetical protein
MALVALVLALLVHVDGRQHERAAPAAPGATRALLLSALRGGKGGHGGTDHSLYKPPDEWAPLTEAELRMIKLMRARFRDHPGVHDDLILEAVRGFEHAGENWREVSEAALETMLIKRAAIDADSILRRGVARRSTFCSLYLCGHHGFDREGHPIYFERTGAINPRELFDAFGGVDGEDELLINHVFVQEAMRALKLQRTQETGRRIYKHVAVTDLSGLGPQHLSKQLLRLVKRTMAFHEAAYPETLHNLYIVNAPGFFAFAWKIVRPWLHPLTAAKVHVLGRRYLDELSAAGIDADQLPAFLGGTGGELEQFWEPWDEAALPTLDHYLQTTVPGADLQDLGDAAFDTDAPHAADDDVTRLRARPEAADGDGDADGADAEAEAAAAEEAAADEAAAALLAEESEHLGGGGGEEEGEEGGGGESDSRGAAEALREADDDGSED